VPGSLLVLGGFWRLVKTMHKIDVESLAKSCQNASKFDQNGTHERSESGLGSRLFVGHAKTLRIGQNWEAFWRHLADFGRDFGPSWLAKGSQNHPFWHKILKK